MSDANLAEGSVGSATCPGSGKPVVGKGSRIGPPGYNYGVCSSCGFEVLLHDDGCARPHAMSQASFTVDNKELCSGSGQKAEKMPDKDRYPNVGACPGCKIFMHAVRKDGTMWPHLRGGAIVSTVCRRCETRTATENWVGDGGVMGFVHGMYERWCEQCCVEEALKGCRESVARIPELEKKLAELIAAEGDAP